MQSRGEGKHYPSALDHFVWLMRRKCIWPPQQRANRAPCAFLIGGGERKKFCQKGRFLFLSKLLHRLRGAKAANIPRLLPDFRDTHKNDKNRVDFGHAVLHKAAHELTATWRAIRDHPVRRDRKAKLGGVSEWLKETDCKSVRLAYAGSNPASSTIFALMSRAGVAQW